MTTDHQCRVCGVPLPRKSGHPRIGCDLHRPKYWLRQQQWQAANGAALRLRLGHRALLPAVCACGTQFNTYKAFEQCSACRQLVRPR
jgi:hypothetical protein